MAAIDTLLPTVVEWFCLDCKKHFFCVWPPKCPTCGESGLNEAWLENQRRSDDEYWEIRKKAAAEEKARREKWKAEAEQRAVEWKRRKEILSEYLNSAGVPLPADEKVYGHAHLWMHRPKMVVNFFKRYNYWISQLPSLIAVRQAKWEIDQQIIRMRKNTGLSYAEIGEIVDLSRGRVQKIYGTYVWHSQYKVKGWWRTTSPVEKWLRETEYLEEVREGLKKQARKQRERAEKAAAYAKFY